MTDNEEDAIRNGFGGAAIRGLAQLAGWLGEGAAAARSGAMADAISAGLLRELLRFNGSEAYFVDGRSGPGAAHAAVHSTLYAVAGAGVVDDGANATLAAALTRYLRRRDTGGSSCMTGRWLVEALYRLGVAEPDAADFALELMSREAAPGWGAMIALGATMSLEAWTPPEKWNTDFAHPWCAAPAHLIPRRLLGVAPLAPGWARLRAAPQPGALRAAAGVVPTPLGPLRANFTQGAGAAGVALALEVPVGAAAEVCLPPLHAALGGGGVGAAAAAAAGDALTVDGAPVAARAWGRLLCTVADVGAGAHVVARA